jgi:hypothetical protein
VTPEEKQRHSVLVSRYTHAARLLDAIDLLSPENFATWLEHLTELFDSIDERLGRAEKRIDDAGIPPVDDGIPDADVPRYLALYTVNPIADHMDEPVDLRQRLAAYRDAQPAGEETSS